jgi:hypothetical protein
MFLKKKNLWVKIKKSFEISRIYICYKLESSKLIKYFSNMCGSYPCIRVVNFDDFFLLLYCQWFNKWFCFIWFVCVCVFWGSFHQLAWTWLLFHIKMKTMRWPLESPSICSTHQAIIGIIRMHYSKGFYSILVSIFPFLSWMSCAPYLQLIYSHIISIERVVRF